MGALELVAGLTREGFIDDLAGETGTVAGPIAKREAETMLGDSHQGLPDPLGSVRAPELHRIARHDWLL